MKHSRLIGSVATLALVGALSVAGSASATSTFTGSTNITCTTSTGYTFWIRSTAKGVVSHRTSYPDNSWPKGTFSTFTYSTTNTHLSKLWTYSIFAGDGSGIVGNISNPGPSGCGVN